MIRFTVARVSILACTAALLLPVVGQAAPKAANRITPAQAEAAAVKKIHGTAQSAKYEFEDGRWQYAVLVKQGSALYEVEVNAQTGKVMDSERTSAAEEKSEAAADKKAAMKSHASSGSKNSAPATKEKGEIGEKSDAGEKG